MDIAITTSTLLDLGSLDELKDEVMDISNATYSLLLIGELKEDLRAEMLPFNTRAFQQRNEDLGTRLGDTSINHKNKL